MSEIIRSIEKAQLRTDLPTFGIGDTVRVFVKVVEGSRERLQAFEGTVMAKRNGGIRETFTVRKISFSIGVERTFPVHSPKIDKIEVVRHGDVRRAMERRRAEFFNIKAADIATPNPKTISADRKLIEAEKMMTRNKVTSLLVTDEAGKLQGVIQIYDIKL